jgi:radical SAM superfamily enzyme YgiQ (UPF0313 family)
LHFSTKTGLIFDVVSFRAHRLRATVVGVIPLGSMAMPDIVLIHPRFPSAYWGMEHALGLLGSRAVLPPASLPLLAALTPPSFSVTVMDENVEPIDFERCSRADIVGLTGMFVQRDRMREILIELRRHAVCIVVGGAWITVQEADFGDLVDVIFIGEADESWPKFLEDWTAGHHQPRYEQLDRTDLTKLPEPRLDLVPMKQYQFGSIQMTRGCPFTCEFCDIIVVFGRKPRIKSSRQIIAELDQLLEAGKRTIFIVDDNLIGNKKAIKPILADIISWQKKHEYSVDFAAEASIDLAEDKELMELMVEANITQVFIGIETPNEKSLRETKKIQNLSDTRGTMIDKVRQIQDAGMEVWSGMIVGFDNDDLSVFRLQREFIQESHIVNTMVNQLVAIPRTPLYDRLDKEGRLDHSLDAFRRGTNVIPKQMTRKQLYGSSALLMRDIYEPQAYFERLDNLYLDRGLRPAPARARYLRSHPIRSLISNMRLLGEAAAIILHLTFGINHAELRREYRRRLINAAFRCRSVAVLQIYALKCALHFHSFMMAQQMIAQSEAIELVRPEDAAQPGETAEARAA